MEGSSVQDEAKIFRDLAAHVMPSVVVVEDTLNNGSCCAGCVILQTKADTFVLTSAKMVKQPGLVVHFSEEPPKPAECLLSYGCFSVLVIGEAHKTCRSVTWKGPVDDSDVLIFVPNSTRGYEKIKGFISKGSCESADGDASPDNELEGSGHYFITLCHHRETKTMVSTPVFSKAGEAGGVVIDDCLSVDNKDGHAQKICLSATGVEEALKSMTKDSDWQAALSNMVAQKAERKRSPGDTETKGERSQPKRAEKKRSPGDSETKGERSQPKKHKKKRSPGDSETKGERSQPKKHKKKRSPGDAETKGETSRRKKVRSS